LRVDGEKLNFFSVASTLLESDIAEQRIKLHKKKISDIIGNLDSSTLGFLHLDAPKTWFDLKPLFFHYLTKIRQGGLIVFQDYFYHWSSSYIAAVFWLIYYGYISPFRSAASSLYCRVEKPFDINDLLTLDFCLTDSVKTGVLIKQAVEFQYPEMDRPEIFTDRLLLAFVEHLMNNGGSGYAFELLHKRFSSGGITLAFIRDFLEQARYRFSWFDGHLDDNKIYLDKHIKEIAIENFSHIKGS
jgi:hypothetical protein